VTEEPDRAYVPREEIEHAVRSLSPADWARLHRLATRFAAGKPTQARDLLQESLMRALDGRQCPNALGMLPFLAGIMRSVADGEREKAERRIPLVMAATSETVEVQILNYADPASTAEDALIAEENAKQIRGAILGLFDDDPIARDIVEGMMEGWPPEELRELSGLDQTAYDSKRKLIRRRIDKRYPKGWQP